MWLRNFVNHLCTSELLRRQLRISILSLKKLNCLQVVLSGSSVVPHICNPSTQETKTGRLFLEISVRVHSEFQSSLGYLANLSQNTKQKKRNKKVILENSYFIIFQSFFFNFDKDISLGFCHQNCT